MFFLYFQPISLLKKRILKYSLNFSIIWIDYVINLRSKTLLYLKFHFPKGYVLLELITSLHLQNRVMLLIKKILM